jgi:hypothetical protein
MPTNAETRLGFKVQGAAEANRLMGRLAKTQQEGAKQQLKSMRSSQEEIKKLQDKLKSLTLMQVALSKEMENAGDTGKKAYKELAQSFKEVEREGRMVEGTLRKMQKAFGDTALKKKDLDKSLSKGAVLQGFLQGAMPGMSNFLQRGPGMRRQVAGQVAGAGLRGAFQRISGGAMGTAFQGAQGLAGALGVAGVPLAQAAQQSQAALQLQQTRMAAMPFLGGIGLGGRMGRAGRAGQRAAGASLDPEAVAGDFRFTMGDFEKRDLARRRGIARNRVRSIQAQGGGAATSAREIGAGQVAAREMTPGDVTAMRGEFVSAKVSAQERRRELARQRGEGRTRERFFGGMTRRGQRLGMSATEVTQMMGQVSQAGGGTGDELSRGGMGAAALVSSRLGMGADVGGAFIAQQREAMRTGGGRGRAGQQLIKQFASGMKLGLEGSELVEHTSATAQAVMQGAKDGYKFDTTSLNAMSQELSKAFGGAGGARVGRQLIQGAQQMAQTGPMNTTQMRLMRNMGMGQGAESVMETRRMLESGKIPPKALRKTLQQAAAIHGEGLTGQSQALRQARIQQVMQDLGAQIGPQRAKMLEEQLRTDKDLVDPFKKKGEKAAEQFKTPQGALDAMATLTRKIAPNAVRQAEIANKQIQTGQKMIGAMQTFTDAQNNLSAGVANLIAGPIGNLGKAIDGMTSMFETATGGRVVNASFDIEG